MTVTGLQPEIAIGEHKSRERGYGGFRSPAEVQGWF